MKRFKKAGAMYAEIESLRSAESDRREDRATVSNFFNGAPPLTDEEAEELGFTMNVNHLFGYQELTDASDQFLAFFNKPTNRFLVELDVAPPGKASLWGMDATAEANRVINKLKGFKEHYRGWCGDVAMHGEGVFHWVSKTFPTPRQAPLSKMLVPDSASTDVCELPYFCREGSLDLGFLHRIADRKFKGWKTARVRELMRTFYEPHVNTGNSYDDSNLEELEYRRQENSAKNERPKLNWPVYFFYQKRCDLRGEPVECVILDKEKHQGPDGNDSPEEGLLYQSEACYDSMPVIIQPAFMDCTIGGEPKWHRVMGLGHLNYSLNQAVELLVNRAMQATMEGSMNLWQMKDSATRDAAQQILLKHNGIVPEGMQLISNRFEPNLKGILEMIQFYRQAGSKNARQVTPNAGDQNDTLEVQAVFQQNMAASSINNRAANAYDYLDRMWEEVFCRLCNPFIDPREEGYSTILDFQAAMERKGIPLYYLQRHNVRVKAQRIVGDGMRAKEVAAATFLSQNRQQFAPEVQPKITRIITSLSLDNYQLADELTPIQEEPDVPQQMRADAENATMLTMRKPATPKPDDIDELHVLGHFPAMEVLIKDGIQYQQASFTPQQLEAFQAVGAHIIQHIQRIEGKAANNKNDSRRQQARAFMEQLNQMAAMGQKLANNLQQKQEGQQQEPLSQEAQARLQLEAEKLAFQREKLQLNNEKWMHQQSFREDEAARSHMLKMDDNRRKDIDSKHERAISDVETALKVSTPPGTSAGK